MKIRLTHPPPRKLAILLFFWVFSSRLMKSFTKQPCIPWVNFWCVFGTSLERKSCFTPFSSPHVGLFWPQLFFHCWAWLMITTFRSWLSCDHFREVPSSGPHQDQFPPGWFIAQRVRTFKIPSPLLGNNDQETALSQIKWKVAQMK